MFRSTRGHGTYVIDRRYKGIGRIRRASGTVDEDTFNSIVAMMKEFHSTGKHTILKEIRDGVLTPIEVYGYYTEGKLEYLPSAATIKLIVPTVTDWIPHHSVTDTTKKNYTFAVKRLVKLGGNGELQDIPKILKAYRHLCMEEDKSRTFNYVRTTLLAYLRANFGKSHSLYRQTSDVRGLKETVKRQAPQLTVPEAISLIKQLPKPHADIVRTMLFTGMHWSEIIGTWSVKPDRVVINGTKTAGRERIVPLIDKDLSKPTRASKAFRSQLRKINPNLSPYSFRRSYAHWMEEASIPRIRRRMYLGHGNTDVTDKYERVEVERFLHDDAEALRSYIFKSWREREVEEDEGQARTIFLFKSKRQ